MLVGVSSIIMSTRDAVLATPVESTFATIWSNSSSGSISKLSIYRTLHVALGVLEEE